MAELPDGASVSHANPVTQAGFMQIPNAVALRKDLQPAAKLVYGYLKHLAWRNGAGGSDPPRQVISDDLAMSEKTVTESIRALQHVGLVTAVRRGQGRTNAYLVNDPVDVPESGRSRKADSAFLEGQDRPIPARARSSSGIRRKAKKGETPLSPPVEGPDSGPPPIGMVEGRNLPLDALCEECGIAESSPRYQQAIVVLNGRRHKQTGELVERGIAHLFWEECLAWAAEHDRQEEIAAAFEGSRFAESLAKAIRRKAALYRETLRGATLAPAGFRNWWLDLELQSRPDRGLTPDEMRAWGQSNAIRP